MVQICALGWGYCGLSLGLSLGLWFGLSFGLSFVLWLWLGQGLALLVLGMFVHFFIDYCANYAYTMIVLLTNSWWAFYRRAWLRLLLAMASVLACYGFGACVNGFVCWLVLHGWLRYLFTYNCWNLRIYLVLICGCIYMLCVIAWALILL